MNLRREQFGEEIGACEYLLRAADGSERPVRVRVGRPYVDGAGIWACPVELSGFEQRYPDIRGEDSLQALVLALSLVWRRLQDFVEKGGTVLDREGHAYTLDELRRTLGR
jgi:uncharacterized protein DUF6968